MPSASGGAVRQCLWKSLEAVRADQQRLLGIAGDVVAMVPGARLAADQTYRLVDMAVDHAQDMAPRSRAEIARIITTFHSADARAQASSIHVNAWFGTHDKASTAERLLEEVFGVVGPAG
ncbi:hypothetical protein [Arhodomonas aquaeolei]|uniref:hypothetical protein n=1 Tax=Arhodomonas aquaeolei TaxID=2369 RepID=UPI0012EB9C12|nr:hypothetical protein [Arhodomonas aquaeolei]